MSNQMIDLASFAQEGSQGLAYPPEMLDEVMLQLPNNYQSREGTRNES